MEFTYAAMTVQPNVPITFQEEMKMPDAELWIAALNKEVTCL